MFCQYGQLSDQSELLLRTLNADELRTEIIHVLTKNCFSCRFSKLNSEKGSKRKDSLFIHIQSTAILLLQCVKMRLWKSSLLTGKDHHKELKDLFDSENRTINHVRLGLKQKFFKNTNNRNADLRKTSTTIFICFVFAKNIPSSIFSVLNFHVLKLGISSHNLIPLIHPQNKGFFVFEFLPNFDS